MAATVGAEGGGGLVEYADQAIAEALVAIARERGPIRPFLAGHSLGGTLAAIHAALSPQTVGGLVLLSAPLCFQPGVSRFRDALVAMAPTSLSTMAVVPGSLLSQLSAMASPDTFVWSRLRDAGHSLADPLAREIHSRVERWALDEVPLSGRLVHQLFEWLYRDNRLCAGTLRIGQKTVGPSCLRVPTLAVVNRADEIAPRASVMPFLEAMPGKDVRVLEAPQEVGVGLQHLPSWSAARRSPGPGRRSSPGSRPGGDGGSSGSRMSAFNRPGAPRSPGRSAGRRRAR